MAVLGRARDILERNLCLLGLAVAGLACAILVFNQLLVLPLSAHVPRKLMSKIPVKDEIEVTPEMIEAGVFVLWASGSVEGQLGSDRLVVAEIYRAMALLAPSEKTKP